MRFAILPGILFLAGCAGGPNTPLMSALDRGDMETVRRLLARGANVNEPGSYRITPLIWAARNGRVDMIGFLADHGADPNLSAGYADWPPLMHAIHKNQKDSVIALIDRGADPNLKAHGGGTPLIMAAGYGYAPIVETLLARGADPHGRGSDGATALDAAVGGTPDIDRFTVGHCQTDTVKALLERAPDLKLTQNVRGRSAGATAAMGRCGDVLKLVNQKRPKRKSDGSD